MAVLHVWTQNYLQNVRTCPGCPLQPLNRNHFYPLAKVERPEPPLTLAVFGQNYLQNVSLSPPNTKSFQSERRDRFWPAFVIQGVQILLWVMSYLSYFLGFFLLLSYFSYFFPTFPTFWDLILILILILNLYIYFFPTFWYFLLLS